MKKLTNILKLILSPVSIGLLCVLQSLPAYAVPPQTAGLLPLGFLPGDATSEAFGVNANGTVVVGNSSFNHAFRWVAPGPMQSIDPLPADIFANANAVNANGSVVVGLSVNGANDVHAFRWENDIITPLPDLGGVAFASALGVNADGTVIAGASVTPGGEGRAVRWVNGVIEDIGTLGGDISGANGINADGTVVVGSSNVNVGDPSLAFRWVAPNTMQNLGALPGHDTSEAIAVNAVGNVVVGYSGTGNARRAFRWETSVGAMESLGSLPGGTSSQAQAVNADGTVVVGFARASGGAQRAFRWTSATGMQTVEAWLQSAGVIIPAGVATRSAFGVSADGSVVVGQLTSNEAFLAKAESGFITMDSFYESLATTSILPPMVAETGTLIIHGANGYPLSKRLTEDHDRSAWVAGDWARMNSEGKGGLGEMGVYRRVSHHVQAGLGFGKTRDSQHLDFGGKANLNGNYLIGHVMGELPISNLWMTVTGLYYWGHFNTRRGYVNSGLPDSSYGTPDASMAGARARIDWDKMLTLSSFTLSPYVEASMMRTKLDGYTEIDGGFPAIFNARHQNIPEARLGLYGKVPVAQCTDIVGRIEDVYRFTNQGVLTTGELPGLLNFNIPAQTYRRDWVRASLGVDQKIGQGLASLSINITTPGQEARMWMAASYNVQF